MLFCIYLANHHKEAQRLEVIDLENCKVLLVDDDVSILELVSEFLHVMCIPFLTAGSGKQAIEILKKEKFKVIVTDFQMPEVDGIELLA